MGVCRELVTGITVELQILKMESTIKQMHTYATCIYIIDTHICLHIAFISVTPAQVQLTLVMHMLRHKV